MAQTTPKLGLAAWDQPLDPYNYQQLANNWNIIDFHDHTPGRGVLIPYGAIAPGAVGKAQLTGDVLGSRGAVQIATSQTISGSSYTLMATPDQVAGLVLPTNGLIAVWYQATWKESATNAGSAAIFLGTHQVVTGFGTSTGLIAAATTTAYGGAGILQSLCSAPFGLVTTSDNTFNYSGDSTTGQFVGQAGNYSFAQGGSAPQTNQIGNTSFAGVGGPAYIFAAAGTYTVSVQFAASSGTVTALNRKLWVQVMSFS